MTALMSVCNIHKSFRSGRESLKVLRGINFTISKGEFVSIVGHSGTGKSTLLHIMGALDHPDKGRILFEDRDIFSGRPSDIDRFRNRTVGFVFQFHHLLPEFCALENVMFPALVARMNHEDTRRKASSLLAEVGLSDRLHHRPGQLSGGEQQRVAVARALVMDPQVVLADEPTGNLDHVNSSAIFHLLKEVGAKHRLALVMVTHNIELASLADKVLTLSDGMLTGEV